jgi:hypothetical protein
MLRQEGYAQAPPTDDFASVHVIQASEEAQQRGLACSVAPDQADPSSQPDLHLQAAEHGPSTMELLDAASFDHGHAVNDVIHAAPAPHPFGGFFHPST